MRPLLASLFVLLLAIPAAADESGREIAERLCAGCHAVGADGDSPKPQAPPFRTFASKWPLEHLEEALAEGIVVGHDEVQMPEFTFSTEQIDALLAWLEEIGQ